MYSGNKDMTSSYVNSSASVSFVLLELGGVKSTLEQVVEEWITWELGESGFEA